MGFLEIEKNDPEQSVVSSGPPMYTVIGQVGKASQGREVSEDMLVRSEEIL